MKIASKIFGAVSIMLLLLAFVACMVVSIVPRTLGMNTYIVLSGSMEPLIETGSLAYIDKKDADPIVGQVVAYQLPNGEVVTHRIISENDDGTFTTKGDANDTEDMNSVSKDQVIGTYVTSIPKLGFFLEKTSKIIPVYLFWVVLCNIIAVACNFFSSQKEKEKEREDDSTGVLNIEDEGDYETVAQNDENISSEVNERSIQIQDA